MREAQSFLFLLCGIALIAAPPANATPPPGMSRIPGGELALPFRAAAADSGAARIQVKPFLLDVRAVNTAEYLAFVRAHPRYARSAIPPLLADDGYLRNWKTDLQPDALSLNSPVIAVSWHAAKAYCAAQGKRLPATAEWELVAATTLENKSAAPEGAAAAHERAILAWYARKASDDPPVSGTGTRHAHGVRDLFGVVWEWTADFNAWSGSGVNRRGVTEAKGDGGLFCGGAPASMLPNTPYATYMRWAFRASLKPDYTVATLGFRCARDNEENAK